MIDGRDVTEAPVEKRQIGMVFQSYALFPTMTVYENIAFGLKVRKMKADEIKRRVDEVAEKIRISATQLDRNVSELSGGQQQRIAIARALAMKPELLLFDEPTSALDPELEVEVLNIIRRLVDEKQTIVIITHKMSFAREVADKVVFFDEGKILKEGTYAELEQSNIPRITQFLNMLN